MKSGLRFRLCNCETYNGRISSAAKTIRERRKIRERRNRGKAEEEEIVFTGEYVSERSKIRIMNLESDSER